MSDVIPEDSTSAPTPPSLAQRLAAEAIGTFVLVLVGLGAISFSIAQALERYSGEDYAPDLEDLLGNNGVTLGLTFGFLLVALVFALHRVSGAHLNPAVSVGAAAAGRLSWLDAARYSAAQVIGGILGGAVLLLLMQGFETFDAFAFPLTTSSFGDDGTGVALWSALLFEIVMTAVFVLVVLAATDRRSSMTMLAPLAIGLAFGALYVAAGAVDGGGLNPARSLASNLFSGGDAVKQVWLFVVGPLLGGLVGGAGYLAIFGRDGDVVPGSGLVPPAGSGKGSPGQPDHTQQWGQPGGYQAPGQQAPQAEAPIIQDGWQWDPQANQWIPAQQQPGQDWQGGSTQIRGPQG